MEYGERFSDEPQFDPRAAVLIRKSAYAENVPQTRTRVRASSKDEDEPLPSARGRILANEAKEGVGVFGPREAPTFGCRK